MDLNLKGKTALVTGGGSGLGRAITEEFAREGVNVTVSYRSKEKETKAFLEELNSRYGTRSIAVKADISNKQDLSSLFDTACETFGKLDILVNNAGVWLSSYVKDMPEEDFEKTFAVDLEAPFLLSK
ncbi:MAG: SDR family oxidoreductase, partial [Ruminococcaceae bacterium]|nr:SDR family oxidoreductase [Oscillospiraceae bacterium]